MSKAEEFIQVNTRNCSSDIIGWYNNGLPIYTPWLTPNQAEKDLELTYDDICEIMEIREDVLEMDSYENLYEEVLKRFKERKETKD